MSLLDQIGSLRDTISDQTRIVKAQRAELDDKTRSEAAKAKELKEIHESLRSFWISLGKYSVSHQENKTGVETATLPAFTAADIETLPKPDVVNKIKQMFGAVAHALDENRSEIKALWNEFNTQTASTLDDWNTLKASLDASKKIESFREDTPLVSNVSRSKTPTRLPPTPPSDVSPKPIPSLVNSASQDASSNRPEGDSKAEKQKVPAGQPKSSKVDTKAITTEELARRSDPKSPTSTRNSKK